MKILKGDEVKVVLGKDSGKVAKVSRVLPKESKIFVEGVNVYKRSLRAGALKSHTGQDTAKGQIVDIQKPVDISNVMLLCPNCKRPTRVGFKFEGDKKIRICRRCLKKLTYE